MSPPPSTGRTGSQTVDHAAAAVDALQSTPGRFVLAYGNIQAAPWEWTAQPEVRSFLQQRKDAADDRLGVQLAFDVLGDPGFPERPAFELARELGLPVTTHAGVWGATNDDGIRLMHENGFATPDTVYVHAATLDTDSYLRIAASGGSVSVSTESEQSAGQGYPPTWQVRRFDIPVSLSMDTSVWWSGDLFSAMRSTLGADRAREHLEAHVAGETVTSSHLRAEHVVEWATRGGANALRRDDLGSLAVGQKADLVLIKNDHSPVSFPLLNPYGHVAFQAQRGDVHTVIIDGTDRQARSPAGRGGSRGGPPGGGEHHRPPALRARRGGLAGRHAPGSARRRQGARQPVHLHRLPQRQHPRGAGVDLRGVGGRLTSTVEEPRRG